MAHRDDTKMTPAGISGVLEAAVYADDLDAAEDFYGRLLGLERILRAGNRHVFFRAGPTIVLVFNPAETARPSASPALPVPPHGATGPGHICFAVPGSALDGLAELFRREGLPVEADFRWPNGARSIYVRDPAGNSVEFAEPRLWDPA